jgi:predicted nucleic acid-binding protein
MKVLIDTSAWIDFFRDTGGAAGDLVAEFIQLDQAYLTGPVIAELLHGAKGKREMRNLDAVFATIPILDVTGEDWLATGNTLQGLRKKGCTHSVDRCPDTRLSSFLILPFRFQFNKHKPCRIKKALPPASPGLVRSYVYWKGQAEIAL